MQIEERLFICVTLPMKPCRPLILKRTLCWMLACSLLLTPEIDCQSADRLGEQTQAVDVEPNPQIETRKISEISL